MRQVGCTRRVFLLSPHLTKEELNGLAYRIDMLGRNTSINSVLIATSDDDDFEQGALPTTLIDRERTRVPVVDYGEKTGYGKVWHCASGYDPRAVYSSGMYRDSTAMNELFDGLQNLGRATRGVEVSEGGEAVVKSKVPVITVPHGFVNDGGYALCLGSYCLATRDSTYRILNPGRGLSLDPIGLSYILPRLGWEYRQPAAEFPVGKLLALTGMEADASDWVETGLATHLMNEPSKLGMLERCLAELISWEQQGILNTPVRRHGHEEEDTEDCNEQFRNLAVANRINTVTVYAASGEEMWDTKYRGEKVDPSLVLEGEMTPLQGARKSDLVNYAATFESVFRERKVEGMVERLKEIASMEVTDEEEQEVVDLAANMVERMERRSPLALKVVNRLLDLGRGTKETMESCMERERRVQMKLFGMEDFERWGGSGLSLEKEVSGEEVFSRWKHQSLEEVTDDEVKELIG